MKRISIVPFAFSALALLGCPSSDDAPVEPGGESAEASPEPSTAPGTEPSQEVAPQVATALSVRAALAERPDATEAVLAEHDLTIEGFEGLMMEIAADPALSAAYEAATE